MAFGISGTIDAILGRPERAQATGAYGTPAGLGRLGTAYQDYLYKLLTEGPESTETFKRSSTMIRDMLARESTGARERLGQTALQGGFYDSGARLSGLQSIDRASLEVYGTAISQLLSELEGQTLGQILPYLSGASGEGLGVQGLNINADVAKRAQNTEIATSLIGAYTGGG